MFLTIESVLDYVNNDRIACLICGKNYALLSTHLAKAHSTSTKEYKSTYGIPSGIALVGTSTKEKMSNSNNTPIETLRERSKKLPHLKGSNGPHKLYHAKIALISRGNCAKAKTKVDEVSVRKAHQIYLESSCSKACEFLGVRSPTLYKWFNSLGLQKKFPN